MSFIVKTLRLPTTTTTTTTVAPISTTTTTTLPPDPTFPISDASIFVGGFGGDEDVYSPTVPLFNEFSKIIGGGTIGDVTFTIPTNNSNYTETLSGSDFLDLDIKVVFTNNSNVESFVELPRVAIDLPYQSSGITSTFIPVNAATSVSLYTNYRLVVEFDKIIIPASGFVERFITGIVEIGTGAPSSEIINIGIGTITVGDIDIELTRAIPTGNALPIDFINVLGDDVDDVTGTTTFEIAAFQTNGTHVFSPASYDTNTGVGSVIRVNNIPVSGDTSTYLVDHANKIGYADATTPPATTTTTTTTTIPPASAVMSFVTSGFPKSSPDGEYASGEIIQLVATTNSSNFGAVPYKIIVNTLTADNVFFSNVSENSPPVVYTIYVDQDVIDQGSVSVGNYNGTSNQGIFAQLNNDEPVPPNDITTISVDLYADVGNNGSYVLQDSLFYPISTGV